jgi:hypothetical protein
VFVNVPALALVPVVVPAPALAMLVAQVLEPATLFLELESGVKAVMIALQPVE